jgi:methylmalonyl-CoA mutase
MIDKKFYGFDGVSFDEWLAKVEADLKGRPVESLITNLGKDLQVKPFYPRKLKRHIDGPGQFPFSRSSKQNRNAFRIEQSFNVETPEVNKLILESLASGSESIQLDGAIDAVDLESVLKGVHKDFIWIGANSTASLEELEKLQAATNGQVFLNADPFLNNQVTIDQITQSFSVIKQNYWLLSNGSKIANAGGDEIQELTYLLASGNEFLHQLIEKGLTIDEASARISFSVGLGSNFVAQVAKIRAFRILWSNLVKLYQPQHHCSMNCWIHGETVTWNKLDQDCNNNMLRATTEAISGVLGGVDSLNIQTINLSQNDAAHNYRIARNMAHLIEEESYLSDVIDPLGGSYLIENLTENMAHSAWKSFKKIEAGGGIQSYLPKIKSEIQQAKIQRIEAIENGDFSLVGANKYAPKNATEWSAKSELNFIEL